jgi:hypothetical protein
MKFDGSNWVTVGSAGFSVGAVNSTSLAFDGSTPYVAYNDATNGNKATVMKFDGSNWVTVGSAAFSASGAYSTSLAFDGSTPYVAYEDATNGYKATVMKFDGSNWVTVGSAAFSAGAAYSISLAFDGSTPYVAYEDVANSGKATVMSLYTNQKTTTGATSSLPVTLATPVGTNITNLTTAANATKDAGYTYPLDLVNFTATVPGGWTNQVTLTFQTDLKPNDVTARKYNSTTKMYADVPGATITETTLNGQPALQLTYDVTDGGSLDQDGTANGVIVDPVGLATTDTTINSSSSTPSSSSTKPKTPDTGYGTPNHSDPLALAIGAVAIASVGGGLALLYRQKRSKSKDSPGS